MLGQDSACYARLSPVSPFYSCLGQVRSGYFRLGQPRQFMHVYVSFSQVISGYFSLGHIMSSCVCLNQARSRYYSLSHFMSG
jgi:hypothetical protein